MGTSTLNKKYGWRPQLPDHRDHVFAAAPPASLPPHVDLRPDCPQTVYNQGQLGSCTANAIGAAVQFDQIKQKLPSFIPARLFIYYNERSMEGTIKEDAGAVIRDGIKSVATLGVCPETEWPYIESKFATKPSAKCYTDALKYKALTYQAVNQDLNAIKSCLAARFPFTFGFSVFDSFESDAVAKTGVMPMPGANESMLGGHAVLCVGYNDGPDPWAALPGLPPIPPRHCVVRNSWGPGWGAKGYFFMPYEYITGASLASDFWTIRTVL